MLIYNTHRNGRSNNTSIDLQNGKKEENKVKNGYKSRTKRSPGVIRAKVSGGDRSKKSKPRKKLTKKNRKFLEGLGLKVKPEQ